MGREKSRVDDNSVLRASYNQFIAASRRNGRFLRPNFARRLWSMSYAMIGKFQERELFLNAYAMASPTTVEEVVEATKRLLS